MSNLCKCLVGTVALRGICEDREDCVHYVNDLPLLSNKAFTSLRDVEADTAKAAYKRVEAEAIRKLQTDIKANIRGKFKVSHEGKSKPMRSGKFKKPLELTEVENCLHGVYVPLYKSDFMTTTPISAYLYSQIDVVTSIYVYDVESGSQIDVIQYDLVVGLNKLEFPKVSYESYTGVFIAYDAAVVQSYKTEGISSSCACNMPKCMTCGCSSEGGYKYCYEGDLADAMVCEEDLESADVGIWIKYYTECSIESWMCCYADELADILRFGVGMQFFLDVKGQVGVANCLTMMDEDTADKIADYFKDEYDQMIENFIAGIEGDCCCFKCNEMVSIEGSLP